MITAIVPIYNTPTAVLEKCINSIQAQSVVNWELLLIDDGSKQECADFCDIFAQKDNRIRVIHIQNNGVSNARNIGIDSAAGEYICFIDSDDWISPNFFEVLLRKKEKADIIAVSIVKYIEESHQEMEMFDVREDLYLDNNSKLIRSVLGDIPQYDCLMLNAVWGKLYPKRLILSYDIHFHSKLKRLEDCIFNLELILHGAKSVYLVKEKCYFYRMSNGSTLGRFNDNLVNHILEATEDIYGSLKQAHALDIYKNSYGMRIFKNTMIIMNDWYCNNHNSYSFYAKREILYNYLDHECVRVGIESCKGKALGKLGSIFLKLLVNKYYDTFMILYSLKKHVKG